MIGLMFSETTGWRIQYGLYDALVFTHITLGGRARAIIRSSAEFWPTTFLPYASFAILHAGHPSNASARYPKNGHCARCDVLVFARSEPLGSFIAQQQQMIRTFSKRHLAWA